VAAADNATTRLTSAIRREGEREPQLIEATPISSRYFTSIIKTLPLPDCALDATVDNYSLRSICTLDSFTAAFQSRASTQGLACYPRRAYVIIGWRPVGAIFEFAT